MSEKTISIAKGKGSIQHNNRKFETPNIDRLRVKDNIIYVKQDIKEAYQQIFGKSVEEYNARQKKKCRRIDDYYEKIRQSKNGEELFHEVVVQVGDMTDSGYGTDDFNKCRQVLDNYMSDFIERNSHIHVFNAVMHLDEQTPHLHISFIPIGEGYKTGMNVRNSLNKSMEAYSVGDKVGILGWYEREREVLTECANRYGIEITQKNEHRERLSVSEYKQTMREVERLTEAKNDLKNDIKELEHKKIESVEQKKELEELAPKKRLGHVPVEDYEELKKVAENYQSKLKLTEFENEDLKWEIKEVRRDNQKAVKEVLELKQELFESKQANKELRKEREEFKKQIESSVEQKYQHQLNSLKLDVKLEQDMNRGLTKKLEEVREEKKTLVERVTNEWKAKYEELDNTWKEKYSKLEKTFNNVKHKIDVYKQQFTLAVNWGREFVAKNRLSKDDYDEFLKERKQEYNRTYKEADQKVRRNMRYSFGDEKEILEQIDKVAINKLTSNQKVREDGYRLERLKVEDPEAYAVEIAERRRFELEQRKLRQRYAREQDYGQSL